MELDHLAAQSLRAETQQVEITCSGSPERAALDDARGGNET
jgi:hypothetical protein